MPTLCHGLSAGPVVLADTGPSAARQKTIRFVKGGLRYISGKATVRNCVAFETSTATIGLRGTDIEIAVSEDPVNTDPAGMYLKVYTGAAIMEAEDGTQVEVDATNRIAKY